MSSQSNDQCAMDLEFENKVLRSILDNIETGICFVDTSRKIAYNNETQRRLFAWTENAAIGQDVAKAYPNTGHIHAQETKETYHKDFLTFSEYGITVRTTYLPLWDDNCFLGTVGFSKNTDDYKDMSIDAKSVGSIPGNLSLMFDSLYEAIVATDSKGIIVYANKSYDQIAAPKGKSVGTKMNIEGLASLAMQTMYDAKRLHNRDFYINDKQSDVIAIPITTDSPDTVVGCLCIINTDKTISLMAEKLTESRRRAEFHKSLNRIAFQLPDAFKSIIGKNPVLNEQLYKAAKASRADCSVMIRGSNGVGKELVARAIHDASNRADGPFIAVNCAALPETLFESELFGYEAGAFTGADKSGKPGKFEMANGGTIFLDEIGNIPASLQAKLLRILQDTENERVGSVKKQKLNIRVLAATNKNLEQMIATGEFREDLFYRLNVVSLTIPDLKDRKEDIPLLAKYFLGKYSGQSGENKKSIRIAEATMELLMEYNWPGNIRELGNTIESAIVLMDGNTIYPYHMPGNVWNYSKEPEALPELFGEEILPLTSLLEEVERKAIINALKKAGSNKSKAMESLGLSRRSFYYKLNKYRIDDRAINAD